MIEPYSFNSPGDFAAEVLQRIGERVTDQEVPDVEALTRIVESIFVASLRVEEGQSLAAEFAYIDPANPDPHPPRRITADRWQAHRLSEFIGLASPALMKLAVATDPRTSWLAIHSDEDRGPYVWGLLDQSGKSYSFINHDSRSGAAGPGCLRLRVEGAGRLSAWIEFEKIAELRVGSVPAPAIGVFRDGIVLDRIAVGVHQYLAAVRDEVGDEAFSLRDHWEASLAGEWLRALSRLLLRIRGYGHGGALLIAPSDHDTGLNLKFEANYPRMATSLHRSGVLLIENTNASDAIHERCWDDLKCIDDAVPVDMYLDESVSENELRDTYAELDAAIWFVSLLTRVDGLVLLTPQLEVRAFGVEITVADRPDRVVRAFDVEAGDTQAIDYNHFGTRHRSMMRFCDAVPGSVGLVVSQDGEVRAITKVEEDLVIWDDIQLQLENLPLDRRQMTNADESSR